MQWFCFITLPLSLKNYEIHYRISTKKTLNDYNRSMFHFPHFLHPFFLPFLSFWLFLLSHYSPSHLLSTVFFVISPTAVHWSCFCSLFWCYLTSTRSLAAFPDPLRYPSSAIWEHGRPISYNPLCQLTLHFRRLSNTSTMCSPLPKITQGEQ